MLKQRGFSLKLPLHDVMTSLSVFVTVWLKPGHQMKDREKKMMNRLKLLLEIRQEGLKDPPFKQ